MLDLDLQSENRSQKCLSCEYVVEKKAKKEMREEYYNPFPFQLVFVDHSLYVKYWDTRFTGSHNTVNKTDKVPTLLNFTRSNRRKQSDKNQLLATSIF